MKHPSPLKKNPVFQYKFDFEIGYLVKSPCRECMERKKLPKCIDGCGDIDRIQAILAETVSCSKNR